MAEPIDANVRVVTWSAIGLVVALCVTSLVTAALFHQLTKRHPSPDAPSRIAQEPRALPSPPRLQTDPVGELEKFQRAEDAALSSYGWIDREAGVIRIPIERAMELTAQRGLPTRGPGTENASGVTSLQMQERKAAAKNP